MNSSLSPARGGEGRGEGAARRLTRITLALLATLLALTAALFAVACHALAPQPGEWSHTLRFGPRGWQFERPVSVPALLRVATHPLGLALLDGRSTDTSLGRWAWQRVAPDRLAGRCAPCRLQFDALGPQPLLLPRAELQLQRVAQERYRGTLTLGEGEQAVVLKGRAQLTSTGLVIDAELADTALADVYAAFGPTAIPELRRAHIDGRVAAKLNLRLPERRLVVQPRIDGFEVSGLGTEALLDAAPAMACASRQPAGEAGTRVIGWLPRAVVAAEDQRFAEHAGYDLPQLLAAWSANQKQPPLAAGGARPQGASTLTQQLAKLVYTGDERSAVRKLRELLYAVEMERTLGKGRILQLYLAIAPWGEGVCGAEAAARHYLRKSTARLTPLEAAWLASLLRGAPSVGGPGAVDTERVGWVLTSLRGPLPAERRAEQMEVLRSGWQPPARH
ncbi:biosynthetic peptidoglycan transglycosylase [Methylibium petroleiphilum]|uniref:biosynthetic peptidoglycan transglycosylase n=1 Tax=Methylibium petroleiphilum TaxID=105560 RepID=UPI003D271095